MGFSVPCVSHSSDSVVVPLGDALHRDTQATDDEAKLGLFLQCSLLLIALSITALVHT